MKTRGNWMGLGLAMLAGVWMGGLFPVKGAESADIVRIVAKVGTVEIVQAGAVPPDWNPVETNAVLRAGSHLRTKKHSSVMLQMPDGGVQRYPENTEIEILSVKPGGRSELRLKKGALSFFHKDEPQRLEVLTRGSYAGSDGTEFVMEVEEVNGVERVTLYVIDGQVTVTNAFGLERVTNGQMATIEEGQKPVRSAGFIVNNVLQWALYYPAVLDLRDLPLGEAEVQALTNSLASYRKGDLLAALANYPAGRLPASEAERVYRAALLLSVGNVADAEAALAALPAAEPTATISRLAGALRMLIAAVKRQPRPTLPEPVLPSEFLAASYYEQSRAVRESSLRAALALARRAATNSPGFSFAWARVAELEFGFGRTGAANEALKRSLDSADRNAQALALSGFVAAAHNRTLEAQNLFDRSIAVDPALANAWLGRGLVSIRRGDDAAGRTDLLVAAALEPQRSLLRSYLGKALANSGDLPRALHEMDLAKQLDPADPTPWLYSALLNEQANRINEGIRDLGRSVELNDNRLLVRSQELLDQDRAVRQANLARLYRDAGLTSWSLFEAGRAVASDYANYSAHLFLANTYDGLRDPNRINLRYETPAESEYLIANLLAPAGAGLASQNVSQQEYSRLFERDRLGVSSATEYLSRGAWEQRGAQFGLFRDSSYLFEAIYRTDPGERGNGDFEERELRLHLKHQLTPRDAIYFRAIDYAADGGDTRQYYHQSQASAALRTKENQSPVLHAGYQHEWAPGVQTLLLAGRVEDSYSLKDRRYPTYFLLDPQDSPPTDFELMYSRLRYQAELRIYSAELQQIWKQGDHNTIVGGRVQAGDIESRNFQKDHVVFSDINGYFRAGVPLARQRVEGDFNRIGAYAYHDWQVQPRIQFTAGVAYDQIRYPANLVRPPVSGRQAEAAQFSPKAGLIWTPGPATTVRVGYARALSGASSEQAYALEPTQIAGFNQSFRGVEPESVGGSGEGVKLEMLGASIERKFGPDTFVALSAQHLRGHERRTVGVFLYDELQFYVRPSATANTRDYEEQTVLLSFNRLIQRDWSAGVSYRVARASLENDFAAVPPSAYTVRVRPHTETAAVLQQVRLHAGYQSDYGFFWLGEGLWTRQDNIEGYTPALAGDDFWQLNAFVGYRFPARRAELRLGLLNITDQDYRLNPLNLHEELPRARTLSVRLQFHF